jgi:hypothetical protein
MIRKAGIGLRRIMVKQELERDDGSESHHASESERVAQAVEHVTFNHGVEGSSPSALTTTQNRSSTKICRLLRARDRVDEPVVTLSASLALPLFLIAASEVSAG